jgi:hypothetical protein
MTEAVIGPEAVSHSAENDQPHSTSTDCWCAPRRERFRYDDEHGASGHWEVFNRGTEKWEVKGSG